ncbi:MAG TPA: hypothetical protein DEQ09_08205 [Bacteroidales bacterium]|nr:hypothetical protein [Bacteroidales bacterium]
MNQITLIPVKQTKILIRINYQIKLQVIFIKKASTFAGASLQTRVLLRWTEKAEASSCTKAFEDGKGLVSYFYKELISQ